MFPVAFLHYNPRAPSLVCYILPSHCPLLDIAIASSLRRRRAFGYCSFSPFPPWISTSFPSSPRGSVASESNFTFLLTFPFLLTRFVAYLYHRVGLCSYKYPRPALLKSRQLGPFFLFSSHVCQHFSLSIDRRPLEPTCRHLSFCLADSYTSDRPPTL